MERQKFAIGLLITGFITGIVGNIFFYAQSPGLSVPLFILMLLIPILGWTSLIYEMPGLRKLWVIVPILFFAVMFMFRANEMLLLLDAMAILALMALFLHYLNHEQNIDTTGTPDHVIAMMATAGTSLSGAGQELGHAWKWLNNKQWKNLSPFIAIGRGLLFAIPIVLVFAILFSSADAVFSERMTDLLHIFAFDNLGVLGSRTLLMLGIAWITTGLVAYALIQRRIAVIEPEEESQDDSIDDSPDELPKKSPNPFRLGMTETTIILLSIVGLFGFFVFIQFAYFFAGAGAIAEGLTYSEYARRGFFELLAVSVLVLALMLVLDHLTIRKTSTQKIVFLGLSVIKVALTLVIMVSAWQRMVLYEEAYGFTYLRVMPHVFIVWLGILLALGLLNLFHVKPHLFATGLILVTIGYIGTLNLMNLDYYIAERNIARYHNGEELDMCYLEELSIDALPAILDLHNTTDDAEILAYLDYWFYRRQYQLADRYAESTIFELNFAYDFAWQTLEPMTLDRNLQRPSCYLVD